jgi:hypothetical protein
VATTYGPVEQHEAVGINFVVTAETDTSITYEIRYYAQCVEWGFADNQTMTFTGAYASSQDFYFNVPGPSTTVSQLVRTVTHTRTKVYGGGPSYTYTAGVTGQYLGGTPSHSRTFTVPARPASVPDQTPKPTYSNLTSSSVQVNWVAPDSNGDTIDYYRIQISTSSSFSTVLADIYGNLDRVHTFTGLARHTTYYIRVKAINGVGGGAWSPTLTILTLSTAPDAPAIPAVSEIGSNSARGTWVAPNNGGASITGYQLQIWKSGYYSSAILYSTTALTLLVLSLDADSNYNFHVRAINSIGAGDWSPTRVFDTLAGVRLGLDGVWEAVDAYYGKSGAYVKVVPHFGIGGGW